MSQNVKIPLSLLNQAIDLLEYINVSDYDPTIVLEYDIVLSALLKKKQSLDLRQSYAKIIFAEDEDKRFDARMQYLQHKREISDYR